MAEVGIPGPDERAEPIGARSFGWYRSAPSHAASVTLSNRLFDPRGLADRALVALRNVFRARSNDEPVADVMLSTSRPDGYRKANPTAAEMRLVVEVAPASLAFERTTKADLSAAAGVSTGTDRPDRRDHRRRCAVPLTAAAGGTFVSSRCAGPAESPKPPPARPPRRTLPGVRRAAARRWRRRRRG